MKALILVGGYGTRLRPLTFTKAKPLVPFANKAMLIHQVEALKSVGVTEVVLAVAYQPDAMRAEMLEWGTHLNVKFSFSIETSPLGTAGPLALAKHILLAKDGKTDGADEPFFVLNSDVTCLFPLADLLAFHQSHGAEGTILVTKVKDWHKYGVVVFDEVSGKISTFAEKPQTFVGDCINAGIYIFNKGILDRIPLEKTSIETKIFPQMAADGQLYAMQLPGFWMDIGQPKDYLAGLTKFLPALAAKESQHAAIAPVVKESAAVAAGTGSHLVSPAEAAKRGYTVYGCVLVHPTAVIDAGCSLGPNVTLGANVHVGPCCRIHHAAIFERSTIGAGAFIAHSIIGWECKVGSWSRVENGCVFGIDVEVKPEVVLQNVQVLPNKEVKESATDKILM